MEDGEYIGQRVRELRIWRGLSLEVTAQLAGISYGYLGQIERNEKPVARRQTLEGIARALKVHPGEFTNRPLGPGSTVSSAAHAHLEAIEAVLTEYWPGEVPDDAPTRPWKQVRAELTKLIDELRPQSQYEAMAELVPNLIRDLLRHAGKPRQRSAALKGLIGTYHATGRVTSALNAAHLGHLAAERVSQTAKLLEDPEWLGVASWTRAHYISSLSRNRQYELAVEATDAPGSRLESRGMSHLTAALAKAAQGDEDTAKAHLAEAGDMATSLGLANSAWGAGTMNFGTSNVGIWRVTLGVELGAGAGIAEVARDVEWQSISISRQGAYWMELGRGLVEDKRTVKAGLEAFLKAEELTPEQFHANAFVRDAVVTMLGKARRDAGGVELRGLAYRLGVAPV
ncbi:helix-turn-helix domain-containing protein [Amycolatopsis vastitatis]|uniref:Transcriptional regulator n=1 Tax=Amycolatopsis vastitatis TaxID=1905142 RepID=A0A229TF29_9PSEU|nr:helix-turn-helix transcriptional regulator [Amycolatopsis vastitatis]OXM69610.1 transcriptional regulator [Amycolatopsis vastitatis]